MAAKPAAAKLSDFACPPVAGEGAAKLANKTIQRRL